MCYTELNTVYKLSTIKIQKKNNVTAFSRLHTPASLNNKITTPTSTVPSIFLPKKSTKYVPKKTYKVIDSLSSPYKTLTVKTTVLQCSRQVKLNSAHGCLISAKLRD